jgi:hypothetical protein
VRPPWELPPIAHSAEKPIQGFEKAGDDPNASKEWKPVSDRKIGVGLVGYGVCQFAAAFGFQDHPNVEVVAVSDLFPDGPHSTADTKGWRKVCRTQNVHRVPSPACAHLLNLPI